MFLHLLNDPQKASFLVFAHKLAMCDGEDSPEEEATLAAIQEEMEVSIDVSMDEVLGDLDVSAFNTADARIIAMLELLMLAYADNYIHEAEADLVSDLAYRFGLSQSALDRLVDWTSRALALGAQPDETRYNQLVEEAYRIMGY